MTPEQVRSARTLLAQPEHSVTSIAKLLGVSRSTIYKYLRGIRRRRSACSHANRLSGQ
jgi:predicted transcriptional regulator